MRLLLGLFSVAELDEVSPDIPLYIQEGYRRGFANSAALRAAGVTRNTVYPGRTSLVKDNAGNLTGEIAGGTLNAPLSFP